MASEIDREGAWRGHFVESGVGTTKNGFPQFVGRLVADQRFVDSADEMKTFNLTEPGWVDWSGYEQDILAKLVLFGKDKTTGEPKEIFHTESLRNAFGWDGASFASLATTNWSDKPVTFWTNWNEYEGKTSLQVSGIDVGDASPNRSMRTLDADGLKDLDSRFGSLLKASKPIVVSAPAKGAVAGKPVVAPKPPTKPVVPAAASPTPTVAAPVSPTQPPKNAPSKAPPKTAPPKTPAADLLGDGEPTGMTYGAAWEYVLANKGDATDDACAEKWIDASNAVAPGKDESTMTETECKAVAEKAVALLKA